VVATPAVVGVVVGVIVGMGLAWWGSASFPPSLARQVEPSPGRDFDAVVIPGGAALLAIVGIAWSLASAGRAGRTQQAAEGERPSRAVALAAGLGWRPSALIGLRLAFESGPIGARVPGRSARTAVAIAVLGVIGVLVVVDSTDAAIAEPVRYGWSWSVMPDAEGDSVEDALAVLEQSGVIDAGARLVGGAIEVEGRRLQAHAIEDLVGTTSLVIATGRAPATPREIALGGATLRQLGVSVGDGVTVEDAVGVEHELVVVGRAVLPIVNDTTEPGSGAVVAADALAELARGGTEGNVVVTYAPGVDPQRTAAALSDAGLVLSGYSYPQVPGRLLNLEAAGTVFAALALFLAALGAAALAHVLAVAGRRRRVDFAVLRALGFVRAQVRLAVGWQAVAIVVIGCALGVPLGFVVGRLVWRAVVADLHMGDAVSSPLRAAAGTVGAAVVLAVLLAAVPAVIAARRRPAELLRTE
jgi:hypothetical protein